MLAAPIQREPSSEDSSADDVTPEQPAADAAQHVKHTKKKIYKLPDLHICLYAALHKHGGVATLDRLVKDIEPVFDVLRNAKGVPYVTECKEAITQALERSKLFTKPTPTSWGIDPCQAALYSSQLTAEALQATQQLILRRLDSVPSAEKTVAPHLLEPPEAELSALVAYSIACHGGSASAMEIVKDVEPVYAGISSSGRKCRLSCAAAVQDVLETSQFRHSYGKWMLAPSALASPATKKRPLPLPALKKGKKLAMKPPASASSAATQFGEVVATTADDETGGDGTTTNLLGYQWSEEPLPSPPPAAPVADVHPPEPSNLLSPALSAVSSTPSNNNASCHGRTSRNSLLAAR